jgi:hypothetical protein
MIFLSNFFKDNIEVDLGFLFSVLLKSNNVLAVSKLTPDLGKCANKVTSCSGILILSLPINET